MPQNEEIIDAAGERGWWHDSPTAQQLGDLLFLLCSPLLWAFARLVEWIDERMG